MAPDVIVFDHGLDQEACAFLAPRDVVLAHEPAEVDAALAALDAEQRAGRWLAGYASYELGYALEPRLLRLLPRDRRLPLLAFGVYDGPADGAGFLALADAEAVAGGTGLGRPEPVVSEAWYREAFRRIRSYIAAGDCYQVNLTFPLRALWTGSPVGLYGALRRRQEVRHGAFVSIGGGPVLLSRSPELFFRLGSGGMIEARPMKGTAMRHPDPARDAVLRDELAASPKNRAENLMIVDLLRNDIGRLCAPGSVRVPGLFEVETYTTVHQMISRIEGRLLPTVTPSRLFQALFPCGSVTGAPKIRAMEIIREVEPEPRGAYCGAVGWIAPDSRAEFNVAIRTLSLFGGGEALVNVGGGIVHDSTAEGEYEEALWKARFAELTLS
jgi:para-aminobenzoate synthetase component I